MFETHLKGELACCEVQRAALKKGVIVSRPTIEARYDLVLDIDGKLHRAQIKYVDGKDSKASDVVILDLRKQCRNNGKTKLYNKDEVDVVLAYLPSIEKVLWIGSDLFDGRKTISLRLKPSKNGQTKGVVFADDLIW